jgi:D-threo-aldose 1-dehydrogenase
MPNRAQHIYRQEFRFGLGGVSLGNEFNKHTDKEAEGTLEAAWEVGVRYFDVAPWYGFGLAERRSDSAAVGRRLNVPLRRFLG